MTKPSATPAPTSESSDLLGTLFYERLALARTHTLGGQIIISVGLGALFLVAAALCGVYPAKNQPFWMLAGMIASAMLTLQLATARLRTLLPQMLARVHEFPGTPQGQQPGFVTCVQRGLTNSKMAVAGLVFGILNVGLGHLFGLDGLTAPVVLQIGFALIGALCGMAAYGIVVVVACVRSYTQEYQLRFDETHPDGCGGMASIGAAIGFFAIVTLIMGVQIAAYILITDWSNRTTSPLIQLLILGWAVYPFIMSLLVLFAPLTDVHGDAVAYKDRRERELAQELAKHRSAFEAARESDAETRSTILARIEHLEKCRKQVHDMRAWPYSIQLRVNYVLTVVPSIAVAVTSVGDIQGEIRKHGFQNSAVNETDASAPPEEP